MEQRYVDRPTRKLNRLRKRTPSTGMFWCNRCDCNLVGVAQRCQVCGLTHRKHMLKRREIP